MAECEAFMAAPSEEALDKCTKEQLLKLSDHYSVAVIDRRRKDDIKIALRLKLVELGVLASGPVPASPPTVGMPFQTQGLTYEQQKELLLLQLEHEKCKYEMEAKKQIELEIIRQREGYRLVAESQRGQGSGVGARPFDINNLRLLPPFNEKDPDSFFVLFERVSATRGWSEEDCALLLQCVLTVILEQFKNTLPGRIATYINERKIASAAEVAVSADEYVLLHKGDARERTPGRDDSGWGGSRRGAAAADQMRSGRSGLFRAESHSRSSFDSSRSCNYCREKGHWKADCPGLRSKHRGSNSNVKPAAAAAPVVSGCVSNVFPSVCEPDVLEAYAPFIRSGFVSLVGSDVKVPVTILRDTGAYDSYMIESVLPLSAETDSGDRILSRGMGLTVLPVPLHKVVLDCELVQVYPSSDGYFQQDNAPCHKARIISDWFLEHDNEFTVLKWPPQSPDLNPIEHLWDVVEREIRIMDVQPTNLQQLRDAIMSIWTKLSEECFQYLVESVPRRIKAVLKAKGGPTRY
ncbi:Transposable element Tcb2 transposase [Merluccius polli]|uniref:Transposable element Tcb2 transposase n=1 Tax=Merluccius polli TaxID=89951 RepID=A0AA47M899_MERPO|nr:Transposable element Tcb2 transposase [Merluccius polli]